MHIINRMTGGIVVAFVLLASPSFASAQETRTSNGTVEQTYLDFQVDQPVRIKTGAPPVYPERLRAAGVNGQVLVQYVVDEKGVAQMATFKVLRSNNVAFTDAVKRAVAETQFQPAEVDGRKVRQLVQQPYTFSLSR